MSTTYKTDIKRRRLDGMYELVICAPFHQFDPEYEAPEEDTYAPTRWIVVGTAHDPEEMYSERNAWKGGRRMLTRGMIFNTAARLEASDIGLEGAA